MNNINVSAIRSFSGRVACGSLLKHHVGQRWLREEELRTMTTAPKKKPVRRGDGAVTHARILNHAERLFSVDGYTGVSLRQITSAAGVDLALVNYYFGSKENLFREVLVRRVDAMSTKRVALLEAIEIRPNDPTTVEKLLDAFLQPIIGTTPKEVKELRNYRLLIALVANSKVWQVVVFKEHYDPVARQFIDALAKTLPDVARADICWAFSFYLGSLVNALAETARIDRLSNGACRSDDLVEAQRQLVQYTAGAFTGLPRQSAGEGMP